MKTIALAAGKGGVGKSTLAAGLAIAAALDAPGLKVALADLDPQGSLTLWWNTRGLPQPVLADMATRSIAALRRDMRGGGCDLLILDCPASFSPILRQAIDASDLTLAVTGASMFDLAAVVSTTKMADQGGVPYRVVLNRAVFRSHIAGAARVELRERGGLLSPSIYQRVSVPSAIAQGRTVQETEPAGAAAREISALWRAVHATLESLGMDGNVARGRA